MGFTFDPDGARHNRRVRTPERPDAANLRHPRLRPRRTRMKPASMIVGISVLALGLAGTPAYAAGGTVDGSITVGDSGCTWTGASTSDTPPNTLTVDHTTVHPTCSG